MRSCGNSHAHIDQLEHVLPSVALYALADKIAALELERLKVLSETDQ